MIFIALGWLAFLIYLSAQSYLSFWPNYSLRIYLKLNLCAAILLTISSVFIASWQAVVINVLWGIFSLLALKDQEMLRSYSFGVTPTLLPAAMLAVLGAAFILFDLDLSIRVLAWSGVWFFCGGYLLFTSQRMTRFQYLILNVGGYLLLLPVYAVQTNWPSFYLGVIWTLISLGGIAKILQTRSA